MRKQKETIELSASDLSNFLSCSHITELDKKVLSGDLNKPEFKNPHAAILRERGEQHEKDYVDYLAKMGLSITRISEEGSYANRQRNTLQAMKDGVDIVVQGVFLEEPWLGITDILRKTDGKSSFGNYTYEVIDTKLSRQTKAGSILQLCLYSALLSKHTNTDPEKMYIVSPGVNFEPLPFRITDYSAYYRLIKKNLKISVDSPYTVYPEPVSHCEICKWFEICDNRRRSDDHLSFVAGLTRAYQNELESVGIKTLADLANADGDYHKQLPNSNSEVLWKIKEQARMQFEARNRGTPEFELLPLQPERGLAKLPVPTEGDIFFDLEGDQFYKDIGIEYLWGVSYTEKGDLKYAHKWAFNFTDESECFDWFINFVSEKQKSFPELKIYHYSGYETGALKRLMGRYGKNEIQIDHLLRTNAFVDLHSIVRQGLIAGIEKYSIKDLEQFYSFKRKAELRSVVSHKRLVEHSIEMERLENISPENKEIVRTYNQDDTDSTYFLRKWLENLRSTAIANGNPIERPIHPDGKTSEELDEHLKRLEDLRSLLQNGIGPLPDDRTSDEQAIWLLSEMISFYRREDKVNYWEKFRMKKLDSIELFEEKSGLSGLRLDGRVGGTDRCPIQRYRFPDQPTDLKKGIDVFQEGLLESDEIKKFGSVDDIDYEENYIDIKKTTGNADYHPHALWAWRKFNTNEKAARVFELATWVSEHGIDSIDPKYKAARNILRNISPELKKTVDRSTSTPLEQTKKLAIQLNNSYLAIQGPPGTGKSYTASRVVLQLLQQGYKVGVTGLSHKVIGNLINKIQQANQSIGVAARICQKTKEEEMINPHVEYLENDQIPQLINSDEPFVLGATDFTWSGQQMEDKLDYLVVDEAGQYSLVGILAIAHATKNIILLGDGAQLKQPIKGSHPDGVEVSALDHIVGDNITLHEDKGIFLPDTYRLHPEICAFNSELFYESRLRSIPGNKVQNISGGSVFAGSHLAIVEVDHVGNSNYADEEVKIIKNIVVDLISENNEYCLFDDGELIRDTISTDKIKIVAPYNAQVNRLKQCLPDLSIGTVDKFQGQEAPIVIYSVTTSTPEDAPRGMEFLYSGNRLNVAVSRAQCLFIMVASPKIFSPDCKTPRQMMLANAYCRFKEMAKSVHWDR